MPATRRISRSPSPSRRQWSRSAMSRSFKNGDPKSILTSSIPMSHGALMLRLLLAAGLGAAIGIEREYRQKPAGLRTNILIAVGSALFTAMSLLVGEGTSPDRIAAQVVTGIGFLGGGAILRSGLNVHGMT